MKTLIYLAVIVLFGVFFVLWLAGERSPVLHKDQDDSLSLKPNKTRESVKELKKKTTLGVDEFMRNTNRYQGTAYVKGVVSAVDETNHRLALIDISEVQKCKTTTCAELTLPVRWKKQMPQQGKSVVVIGAVKKVDDKFIFVAENIQSVKKKDQE